MLHDTPKCCKDTSGDDDVEIIIDGTGELTVQTRQEQTLRTWTSMVQINKPRTPPDTPRLDKKSSSRGRGILMVMLL